MLVSASGTLSLAGNHQVWLGPALSGRTVTVWADRHSVRDSLDDAWIKTVPTRL
jgi:acyl dehydratase